MCIHSIVVIKMKAISSVFALTLSACAAGKSAAVRPLSPLEFTVKVTETGARQVAVDGSEVVGSVYYAQPVKCKGYDEVVARGTGEKTYGELVRVRDCIPNADATADENKFDYADFTPSHELELGPNRIEMRLPTGECIRTTIRIGSKREAPKWSRVDCSRLEALK